MPGRARLGSAIAGGLKPGSTSVECVRETHRLLGAGVPDKSRCMPPAHPLLERDTAPAIAILSGRPVCRRCCPPDSHLAPRVGVLLRRHDLHRNGSALPVRATPRTERCPQGSYGTALSACYRPDRTGTDPTRLSRERVHLDRSAHGPGRCLGQCVAFLSNGAWPPSPSQTGKVEFSL